MPCLVIGRATSDDNIRSKPIHPQVLLHTFLKIMDGCFRQQHYGKSIRKCYLKNRDREKGTTTCLSCPYGQATLSTKLMVLLRCHPTCCHLSSCLLFFRSIFFASVRRPRIQFYRHDIIVHVRRKLFPHMVTTGTNSCMESKQSER